MKSLVEDMAKKRGQRLARGQLFSQKSFQKKIRAPLPTLVRDPLKKEYVMLDNILSLTFGIGGQDSIPQPRWPYFASMNLLQRANFSFCYLHTHLTRRKENAPILPN